MDESSQVGNRVRELFDLYKGPVHRYLCCALRDRETAEDLTQETFIRLYQQFQSGQDIDQIRPWIFRVAHNLAMNALKSARHSPIDHSVELEQESLPCERANAEQDLLEREALLERDAWIAQSLKKLSPQEKQALDLRAEGLRYREIAEVLGVKVPTVQTVLTRAVAKLSRHEVIR